MRLHAGILLQMPRAKKKRKSKQAFSALEFIEGVVAGAVAAAVEHAKADAEALAAGNIEFTESIDDHMNHEPTTMATSGAMTEATTETVFCVSV